MIIVSTLLLLKTDYKHEKIVMIITILYDLLLLMIIMNCQNWMISIVVKENIIVNCPSQICGECMDNYSVSNRSNCIECDYGTVNGIFSLFCMSIYTSTLV